MLLSCTGKLALLCCNTKFAAVAAHTYTISYRVYLLVAVACGLCAVAVQCPAAADVAQQPHTEQVKSSDDGFIKSSDDGFIKLFNGKDLSGWVVEGVKEYKEGNQSKPIWFVEDGKIICAGKGFGFLRYEKPFSDFIFHVEYSMSKGCNSGIGFRTVPYTGPAATRPSFASYEIQILDDAGKPPSKYSSGALYRYLAPTSNPTKPAPEWNVLEIECRGPRIRITLNGQLIHDVDQSTIEELKDKPLAGYFCLQNHGKRIEFRNIRVKQL